MVKVRYLLSERKVLQKSWSSLASLQTRLVCYGTTDIACHVHVCIIDLKLLQEIVSTDSLTFSCCMVGFSTTIELASHGRASGGRHAGEDRS